MSSRLSADPFLLPLRNALRQEEQAAAGTGPDTALISRRTLLSSTAATVLLARRRHIARADFRPRPGAIPPDTEWRHYGGDQANTRYAPLDQINATNFNDLELAWRFKTDALGARKEYQFEGDAAAGEGAPVPDRGCPP